MQSGICKDCARGRWQLPLQFPRPERGGGLRAPAGHPSTSFLWLTALFTASIKPSSNSFVLVHVSLRPLHRCSAIPRASVQLARRGMAEAGAPWAPPVAARAVGAGGLELGGACACSDRGHRSRGRSVMTPACWAGFQQALSRPCWLRDPPQAGGVGPYWRRLAETAASQRCTAFRSAR